MQSLVDPRADREARFIVAFIVLLCASCAYVGMTEAERPLPRAEAGDAR